MGFKLLVQNLKKNSNKHAQLAWGLNSLLKIKNSMLGVKETTR
jgi:hypothetical protein